MERAAYGLDFENNNYESGYDLSIINSDISSYLSNNDEFNYLDSFNSDIFSGEVDYENENVFGFEKPNNNLLAVVEGDYSNDLNSTTSINNANSIDNSELLIIGNEINATTENLLGSNGEEISFDLDTYSVELEGGNNYAFAWYVGGDLLDNYSEIQSILYLWIQMVPR